MAAYNIVRMRVKAGREQEYLDRHQAMNGSTTDAMRKNGFRKGAIVKACERSYCF